MGSGDSGVCVCVCGGCGRRLHTGCVATGIEREGERVCVCVCVCVVSLVVDSTPVV